MRITEVNHTDFSFKDGLQPIHLKDLKRLVVIAGPNGAGKSRLLSRVRNMSGSRVDLDNNARAFELYRELLNLNGPPFTLEEPKFNLIVPEGNRDDDPRRDLYERIKQLVSGGDTNGT